jgi:hypothetical protein
MLRGEVTFLSLLQAQKILTETELAFVESQADRWNGAVQIADLLQLEAFPPTADAPAAMPVDVIAEEIIPAPPAAAKEQAPPAQFPDEPAADAIRPLPAP